eukprot:6132482-Ditylum_brightwellii.AAC.1
MVWQSLRENKHTANYSLAETIPTPCQQGGRGDFLQFTAELWDPPEDENKLSLMEEEDKMDEVDMPEEEWEMWEDKVTV